MRKIKKMFFKRQPNADIFKQGTFCNAGDKSWHLVECKYFHIQKDSCIICAPKQLQRMVREEALIFSVISHKGTCLMQKMIVFFLFPQKVANAIQVVPLACHAMTYRDSASVGGISLAINAPSKTWQILMSLNWDENGSFLTYLQHLIKRFNFFFFFTRPAPGYYFPTLHQLKFEVEDGTSPNSRPVRFGYSSQEFPDFSWRGYAVMSPAQVRPFKLVH